MNIKMTKSYAGPLGTFPKDLPFDLPAETVKQLPKNSFVETCAPEDAYKQTSSPSDKQVKTSKTK
jgi:hypothetical protein